MASKRRKYLIHVEYTLANANNGPDNITNLHMIVKDRSRERAIATANRLSLPNMKIVSVNRVIDRLLDMFHSWCETVKDEETAGKMIADLRLRVKLHQEPAKGGWGNE